MTASERQVRDLVAEQAADWLVENREGLDNEQRRRFTAWLKASPGHIEEYLALSTLAHDLPGACAPGDETIDQLVARAQAEGDATVHSMRPLSGSGRRDHPPRRWRGLAMAASLLALCVGAPLLGRFWDGAQSSRSTADTLHFQTRHGERQTQLLPDQSIVHLNTDSAVTVRFDGKQRLVVMEAGEASFEVAHESQRDFRVATGAAQVIAVGTKFDVRLTSSATVVTVSEGRVKVGLTSHAHGALQNLDAGQQLQVVDAQWPAVPVAVDAARITAWLNGQIRFDNEPLQRVTSEFNRYAPTPFEIATPALRELKISGVFATDDVDAYVAFLRSLRGVRVEVTETRIRVSQK